MNKSWSPIELDIVETLTRRVRLLSLEQIADIWWPEAASFKIVQRNLTGLRKSGLLLRTVVNAQPRLKVKTPLFDWQVGLAAPAIDQVVTRTRGRWRGAAAPTEVCWASPLAANLFGSTAGKLPELQHRDHDLLLGEVYVFYRRKRPQLATLWVGEDARPKAGFRIKDPDAFLIAADGRTLAVIESAGRYGPAQIEAFHAHCAELNLPYELY